MDCPSLLDILGFLQLPKANINLESDKSVSSISIVKTEDLDKNLDKNLEMEREKFNQETMSQESTESGNVLSGGSAEGDSTQIKVIKLGSKKFIYNTNYRPKRKSAKR